MAVFYSERFFLTEFSHSTATNLTIPENITLHWLPPYSPEMNPVEHLWDELREKWLSS